MILTGPLAKNVISLFRGTIDLYLSKGQFIARRWPKKTIQPGTSSQMRTWICMRKVLVWIRTNPKEWHWNIATLWLPKGKSRTDVKRKIGFHLCYADALVRPPIVTGIFTINGGDLNEDYMVVCYKPYDGFDPYYISWEYQVKSSPYWAGKRLSDKQAEALWPRWKWRFYKARKTRSGYVHAHYIWYFRNKTTPKWIYLNTTNHYWMFPVSLCGYYSAIPFVGSTPLSYHHHIHEYANLHCLTPEVSETGDVTTWFNDGKPFPEGDYRIVYWTGCTKWDDVPIRPYNAEHYCVASSLCWKVDFQGETGRVRNDGPGYYSGLSTADYCGRLNHGKSVQFHHYGHSILHPHGEIGMKWELQAHFVPTDNRSTFVLVPESLFDFCPACDD